MHTWKRKRTCCRKKITRPNSITKEATDDNYNAAVDFVLENLDRVAAFFGTHNEKSTELAMDKMQTKGLPHDHENIHFWAVIRNE